jgi:ABC-type molybdate transport system substrate-binding protein
MSANGMKPILAAIAARFEAASGDTLLPTFGETGALLERIEIGESSDVYILPRSALEDLAAAGRLAPDSMAGIASTALAMAVPEGTPMVDPSTAEGFRRWLLGVHSIVMTDPAAGGIGSAHFLAVLQRLDLADAMKGVAVLMAVTILTIEDHTEPACGLDGGEDLVESGADRLERDCSGQCEVEVLGEAVIGKTTSAKRRVALEGKPLAQGMAGEADQEPSKAVVALDNSFRNAESSRGL